MTEPREICSLPPDGSLYQDADCLPISADAAEPKTRCRCVAGLDDAVGTLDRIASSDDSTIAARYRTRYGLRLIDGGHRNSIVIVRGIYLTRDGVRRTNSNLLELIRML